MIIIAAQHFFTTRTTSYIIFHSSFRLFQLLLLLPYQFTAANCNV